MEPLHLIATAAFGLEAVVARELAALGYPATLVEDGRVHFRGDARAIVRTNLWFRAADRVLVCIAEFEATDFGELFDRTTACNWEQWLPVTAAFPVQGRSVKSRLQSVPDCQRIVKKAIVERLKRVYRRDWFVESGPTCRVEVSLLRDRALLTLDTSGDGLHKRGYRRLVGEAPLRETLAAALVLLSYWSPGRPFLDPCCGSGTIPIEAALIGRNRAPGLTRTFAAEAWPQIPAADWEQARIEARDLLLPPLKERLLGTDLSGRALELARHHATLAGVAGDLHLQQRSVSELSTRRTHGCLIANPPYGERLGEQQQATQFVRELGSACRPLETWSLYVLSPHPQFEQLFGRRADRRRKLYNARIACTYYQFHGPRPPRAPAAVDRDVAPTELEPE
jgi:putative N6-adenine-specific DNA methylase